MRPGKAATSEPTSGTDTIGNCPRTMARSAGLSSTKTKLSMPRFSSLAIFAIPSGFGSQFAWNDEKWLSFRIESG